MFSFYFICCNLFLGPHTNKEKIQKKRKEEEVREHETVPLLMTLCSFFPCTCRGRGRISFFPLQRTLSFIPSTCPLTDTTHTRMHCYHTKRRKESCHAVVGVNSAELPHATSPCTKTGQGIITVAPTGYKY